jgi:hypothetical protein
MQMPMFEALARGYLAAAGAFLTPAEKSYLVFAGKLITFTIGLRFLTDYLSGDHYFRVHRQGHNLDRCRTQFKLVQSITEQEEAMQKLVDRIASGEAEPATVRVKSVRKKQPVPAPGGKAQGVRPPPRSSARSRRRRARR